MIPSTPAHLHAAALSHAGMSGKNNEDRSSVASFTLSKDDARPSVFAVVADGIGGHRAGEVAAELAVNTISRGVAESNAKEPVKILETAIHTASQAIFAQSAGKADEEGMGATCACAWVIENKLYTAYVGDSRIYLLRGKYIQRLTIDHTWVQAAYEMGIITVEQMHDHPNVHVLQRHLGGFSLLPRPSLFSHQSAESHSGLFSACSLSSHNSRYLRFQSIKKRIAITSPAPNATQKASSRILKIHNAGAAKMPANTPARAE